MSINLLYEGLVGSKLQELPEWNLKLATYTECKERLQEEADSFRLIGGRFNKQRNLHTRLVLGSCKMNRSPHSPTRILKVYIETLNWVQSHITSRRSQKHIVSSRCLYGWKELPLWVPQYQWNVHFKDGREKELLIALVWLLGHLAVISSQWPPPGEYPRQLCGATGTNLPNSVDRTWIPTHAMMGMHTLQSR